MSRPLYMNVQFFSGQQASVFKRVVLPRLSRAKQPPRMAFLYDQYGHNAMMVHAMLRSAPETIAQSARSKFMVVHEKCQIPLLGYKTDQMQLPEEIQKRATRAPGGHIISLPADFVDKAVLINSDPWNAFQIAQLGANVIFSCGGIIPPNSTEPGAAARAKGEQVIAKAAEFLPGYGFLITPAAPHSAMNPALLKDFREVYHEPMGPVVYTVKNKRAKENRFIY